jgi:hypothetical protein
MNPKGRQKVKHWKAVPTKILINAKRACLLEFSESVNEVLFPLPKFRSMRFIEGTSTVNFLIMLKNRRVSRCILPFF